MPFSTHVRAARTHLQPASSAQTLAIHNTTATLYSGTGPKRGRCTVNKRCRCLLLNEENRVTLSITRTKASGLTFTQHYTTSGDPAIIIPLIYNAGHRMKPDCNGQISTVALSITHINKSFALYRGTRDNKLNWTGEHRIDDFIKGNLSRILGLTL